MLNSPPIHHPHSNFTALQTDGFMLVPPGNDIHIAKPGSEWAIKDDLSLLQWVVTSSNYSWWWGLLSTITTSAGSRVSGVDVKVEAHLTQYWESRLSLSLETLWANGKNSYGEKESFLKIIIIITLAHPNKPVNHLPCALSHSLGLHANLTYTETQ